MFKELTNLSDVLTHIANSRPGQILRDGIRTGGETRAAHGDKSNDQFTRHA